MSEDMDDMEDMSAFSEEEPKNGKGTSTFALFWYSLTFHCLVEAAFNYEVLTSEEVMARPLALIEEVNEVLQVHPMLARQILQYYSWNKVSLNKRRFSLLRVCNSILTSVSFNQKKENALERYFTEQEKIFRKINMPRPEELKTDAVS